MVDIQSFRNMSQGDIDEFVNSAAVRRARALMGIVKGLMAVGICSYVLFFTSFFMRFDEIDDDISRVFVGGMKSLLILFIIMGERGLWPYTPTFFWTPNSLLMVFMSVALFIAFRDWHPKRIGKWCSIVASTTFGIYLLHDGELRQLIWRKLFHCKTDINLIQYVGWMFMVTAIVFLIGMIIDLARQALEERTIVPLIRIIQSRFIMEGQD